MEWAGAVLGRCLWMARRVQDKVLPQWLAALGRCPRMPKRAWGKALLLFAAALCMAGCGGRLRPIAILDGQTETRLSVQEGATVADALEQAELTIGSKDVVSPSLAEKITEGCRYIQIERYAHVSVAEKGQPKELGLTGKKVADALDATGITLREHDVVNHELEAYLTDGMEIIVTRRVLVQILADGKEEACLTEADTVGGLLKEQGIHLDNMDKISPQPEQGLAEGTKIVINRVAVKEVAEREPIPYGTRTEYSNSLYEGETQLRQQGQEGEKEVVYRVTYVDGKEETRELSSETTVKEPVSAVLVKGTKPRRRVVSKEQVFDCDGSGHGYYIITWSDGVVEQEEF